MCAQGERFKCFNGELAQQACGETTFLCFDYEQIDSQDRNFASKALQMIQEKSETCSESSLSQLADEKAARRLMKRCNRVTRKLKLQSTKVAKAIKEFGECNAESSCVQGTLRRTVGKGNTWDNIQCVRDNNNQPVCADGQVPPLGEPAQLNNYFTCASFNQ